MVGLIGYQDNFFIFKIFNGRSILFRKIHIQMQFLRRSKADINRIVVIKSEIIHFLHLNLLAHKLNSIREQILHRVLIEKIFLCFFDNIVLVNKEQKLPVPLRIQVENQTGHNHRFAGSRRHMKERMDLLIFSQFTFNICYKILKSLYLIFAQRYIEI